MRPPYRVDALDVVAAVDNGMLELQRLAGRAWGGRFEASGSADAGSGQLGLRLRADEVDLRALLTDTLGYDGLRGRGLIDADLRSRGATVGALRAALSGRVRWRCGRRRCVASTWRRPWLAGGRRPKPAATP